MTFSENVTNIVDDLDLDKPYDKSIIKHRFLDEISYYEQKSYVIRHILLDPILLNH